MQTFLCELDYHLNASRLDNRRLFNQVNESFVLYQGINYPGFGWRRHPAFLMWKPYRDHLCIYTARICYECQKRGFTSTTINFFFQEYQNLLAQFGTVMSLDVDFSVDSPPFISDIKFINSHRSALLAKKPEYYDQFGWEVEPKIEYVWPVRKVAGNVIYANDFYRHHYSEFYE